MPVLLVRVAMRTVMMARTALADERALCQHICSDPEQESHPAEGRRISGCFRLPQPLVEARLAVAGQLVVRRLSSTEPLVVLR